MKLFNYTTKDDQVGQIECRGRFWLIFARIAILMVFGYMLAFAFPFALIWALNVLFKTNIEYNFTSWLAVVILYVIFKVRYVPPKLHQKTKS
jgi:membrane protein implicated in regulation of membrane protease activity